VTKNKRDLARILTLLTQKTAAARRSGRPPRSSPSRGSPRSKGIGHEREHPADRAGRAPAAKSRIGTVLSAKMRRRWWCSRAPRQARQYGKVPDREEEVQVPRRAPVGQAGRQGADRRDAPISRRSAGAWQRSWSRPKPRFRNTRGRWRSSPMIQMTRSSTSPTTPARRRSPASRCWAAPRSATPPWRRDRRLVKRRWSIAR